MLSSTDLDCFQMRGESSTLATFYRGWQDYQALLVSAIGPLQAEQLALRPAPHLRSIGEAVRHVIGARARWFSYRIHNDTQELIDLATWDREGRPERSSSELTDGLERTWRELQGAMARWTDAEWDEVFEDEGGDPDQYTRSWVVWHLVEHDIHHGGEISITLGMHGLAAPQL
jgi:uncharacterized damage-inducible protein DinB